MTANVTKMEGPVHVYRVYNGGEWAMFYVRSGMLKTDRGYDSRWVDLTIASSHGTWSNFWASVGQRDWWEFLSQVNKDYVMRKLFGTDFEVLVDVEAAFVTLKDQLTDDVKSWGTENAPKYREWIKEVRSRLDEEDDIQSLFDIWNIVTGRDDPIWEYNLRTVNPVVDRVWEQFWLPFTETIKTEGAIHA